MTNPDKYITQEKYHEVMTHSSSVSILLEAIDNDLTREQFLENLVFSLSDELNNHKSTIKNLFV